MPDRAAIIPAQPVAALGVSLEQSAQACRAHGVGARCHVQFRQNMVHVRFHGWFHNVQVVRNGVIGQPGRKQLEDIVLTLGQQLVVRR